MLFKAIVDGKPHELDPTSIEIPWRQDQFEQKRKLCFGVMRDDGLFHATAPMSRGLDETVAALKAAGHEGALEHVTA